MVCPPQAQVEKCVAKCTAGLNWRAGALLLDETNRGSASRLPDHKIGGGTFKLSF